MKKPVVIIAVIIALFGGALVLASMSKDKTSNTSGEMSSEMDMKPSASSSATSEPAKPNEVIIKDFAYGPATLTVKKGTKVTWTNQDEAKHDITPTKGAEDFKKSELLAKGESHSFTFDTVGSYEYKCSPHPYMKGTVVVTE